MNLKLKKYPALAQVVRAAEEEMDTEAEAAYKATAVDPSLRPPKRWWNQKYKEVKKGNPSYDAETIRKTIGDIWYHNLSDEKRKEIRAREGKHYAPAPRSLILKTK